MKYKLVVTLPVTDTYHGELFVRNYWFIWKRAFSFTVWRGWAETDESLIELLNGIMKNAGYAETEYFIVFKK